MEQIRIDIATLDSGSILRFGKLFKGADGHPEIRYSFSMKRDSFDRKKLLVSTDGKKMNALYAQVFHALKENPDIDYYDNQIFAKNLLKHIFILDFGRIFDNHRLNDVFDCRKFEEEVNNGLKTVEVEELLDRINLGLEQDKALLFLFRNGFEVEFDECKRHFVPFESSASMCRDAKVSFVNRELIADLDERLMLGMNLRDEGIQVRPHKYFAYRGLYLTDGVRIGIDGAFDLNEETVIVVKDHYVKRRVKSQITAEQRSADPEYWDIKSRKNETLSINAFDGEGIISPSYAEKINMKLYDGKRMASSFQIRMPFIKGMLHMVDYEAFFRSECRIDYGKEFLIKDAFGIFRDLRKAKIILTKSMTKNYDWLNEYMNRHPDKDPMKCYFEKIRKYNHGLFIARTDINLKHEGGRINLNYQFLNTLDISGEEFRKIADKYINEIKETEKNAYSQRELILKDMEGNEGAWQYALGRNLDFVCEKEIKKKIRKAIDSRIKDIYKGNIRVGGDNRFFAGDLSALLLHIYTQGICCDSSVEKELKSNIMRNNDFKMYEAPFEIEPGGKYGFLRNPHLSRNEECFLKYAPEDKYYEYFKHLTGIIMVAEDSLAPMTLGGADFDGDMVKIISDGIIVNAMIRGKEKCNQVVVIPSAVEKKVEQPAGITYGHVKDTFGNQIGLISNMAIRLGEHEYSYDHGQESKDDLIHHYVPADCTLLTGVEIDAAKTGNHPKKNISEINEQIKSKKKSNNDKTADYLSVLKELQRLDKKEAYIYKTDIKNNPLTDTGNYRIVYKEENEKKELEIPKVDEGSPIIELLPSLYYEAMYKNSENNTTGVSFKRENVMNFKTDNMLHEDYERILEEAHAIVKVYNLFIRRYRRLWKQKQQGGKSKWYGKVMGTFQKQYFGSSRYVDLENALESYYTVIEEFICDASTHSEYGKSVEQRANYILKKIKDTDWIYTPQSKRSQKLLKIIPADVFDSLPESVRQIMILTNFHQKGYMLLYYIVQDIKENKRSSEESEDDLPLRSERSYDLQGNVPDSGKELSYYYKEMYVLASDVLSEAYKTSVREKHSFSRFDSLMQERIYEELIDRKADEYVGAFYSCSEAFFWKFFDKGERFEIFKEAVRVIDKHPYTIKRICKNDLMTDLGKYDEEVDYCAE